MYKPGRNHVYSRFPEKVTQKDRNILPFVQIITILLEQEWVIPKIATVAYNSFQERSNRTPQNYRKGKPRLTSIAVYHLDKSTTAQPASLTLCLQSKIKIFHWKFSDLAWYWAPRRRCRRCPPCYVISYCYPPITIVWHIRSDSC